MNHSMLIRLTKKLAAVMNGVDVSSFNVGDVLELPDAAARMMIEEQWAVPADASPTVSSPRSRTLSPIRSA